MKVQLVAFKFYKLLIKNTFVGYMFETPALKDFKAIRIFSAFHRFGQVCLTWLNLLKLIKFFPTVCLNRVQNKLNNNLA